MPMYNYKCVKCELLVEVMRNISEHDRVPEASELPSEAEIPVDRKCEAHEWKKQIGKTSFKLRGYGWSNTGYWNGK